MRKIHDCINTPYVEFSIQTLLYLIQDSIAEHSLPDFDYDNVIHDYLILLRYYPTAIEAIEEMQRRIRLEVIEMGITDIPKLHLLIEPLLDTLYLQMEHYGLYTPGELDYRYVRTQTLEIYLWEDEFNPIFKFIDEVLPPGKNIERNHYVISGAL